MGAGVDNRGRVMQCMSIDIATSVSDSVVQATDSILRVYAETDVRLWSLENLIPRLWVQELRYLPAWLSILGHYKVTLLK